MSLTSFRQAVQDQLEIDLGISFVAGIVEGPVEERDLGCCWVVGVRERDDVQTEEIIVKARAFKQAKQADGYQRDPSALEAFAETIQLSLRAKQTLLGPWWFRVTELELDLASNGVEATIVGVDDNPFSQGG